MQPASVFQQSGEKSCLFVCFSLFVPFQVCIRIPVQMLSLPMRMGRVGVQSYEKAGCVQGLYMGCFKMPQADTSVKSLGNPHAGSGHAAPAKRVQRIRMKRARIKVQVHVQKKNIPTLLKWNWGKGGDPWNSIDGSLFPFIGEDKLNGIEKNKSPFHGRGDEATFNIPLAALRTHNVSICVACYA